jgi:hypothetical protein
MTDSLNPPAEPRPTPTLTDAPNLAPKSVGEPIPYQRVTNAKQLVETYMDDNAIWVTVDGCPERRRTTADNFASKISRRPIDEKVLEDEMVEFSRRRNLPFKQVDIARAIRLVLRDRADERRAEILEPLIKVELTQSDIERADREFKRFAKIIDAEELIAITGLRQFIWAVKAKQTRINVGYPMMLIFANAVQGSGKSEFVLRLLRPLAELASDPVPFPELSDPRSVGLFKNAVVNFDDAGAISRKMLGALKSAITISSSKRREMRSSYQRRHEHDAVFIATTNEGILDLIPDETGHRRFLALPFKNGAVEKGGSPEIWDIVNTLDYGLLWRAVSENEEEPVKAIMKELHEYQSGYVRPDPLDDWLRTFDAMKESVRNITGPNGIPARKLYMLYCDETGEGISEKAFGSAMNRRIRGDGCPLVKRRVADGEMYRPKPRVQDKPPVESGD